MNRAKNLCISLSVKLREQRVATVGAFRPWAFPSKNPRLIQTANLIVATGYRLKNAGTARFLPHFVRDRGGLSE